MREEWKIEQNHLLFVLAVTSCSLSAITAVWMQTGYYLPLDRNPENVKMPVMKLPIIGAHHETMLQLCGITGYDSPAVL